MAAPTHAGSANAAQSATTPKTITATSVSAGTLLVVIVLQQNAGSNTYTVTDDQGHSYTRVVERAGAATRYASIYYAIVATTTAGSVVVSVAATGGTNYGAVLCWATPPAGATITADASDSQDNASGTAHNCAGAGAINTAADVIVYAAEVTSGNAGGTIGTPAGYTLTQANSPNRAYAWVRASSSALAAERVPFATVNSTASIGIVASFKAAGAVAPSLVLITPWW